MSIINVSDKEFEEKVLKSGDLVVISGQSGVGHANKFLLLEELSSEYKSKNVAIAKMLIDDNPETPAKYGIMSIPSLLLLKMENWFQLKLDYNRKIHIEEWIKSYY